MKPLTLDELRVRFDHRIKTGRYRKVILVMTFNGVRQNIVQGPLTKTGKHRYTVTGESAGGVLTTTVSWKSVKDVLNWNTPYPIIEAEFEYDM